MSIDAYITIAILALAFGLLIRTRLLPVTCSHFSATSITCRNCGPPLAWPHLTGHEMESKTHERSLVKVVVSRRNDAIGRKISELPLAGDPLKANLVAVSRGGQPIDRPLLGVRIKAGDIGVPLTIIVGIVTLILMPLFFDRFVSLQAPPFKAGLREAISGIGAIFATTRCRVITCQILQRQLPYNLPPADNNRHCPKNRCRSLPISAAVARCHLKAPGRSSWRAKNTLIPD